MIPPGRGPYGPQGHGLQDLQRTIIHCYTQNMKALVWALWFRRFFYVFPIVMSMGANDPRGGVIFDPRGMVGRIYKKDHFTLLHTKYENSVPCGFGDFMFFP